MSKHRKKNRGPAPAAPKSTAAPKSRGSRLRNGALVLLGVGLLLAFGFWEWKTNHPAAPPATGASAQGTLTNLPPAAGAAQADFPKLNGRWQRPDGGYIIEVKSVREDGTMDAGYFNPKPIHVAKAQAARADGVVAVFIELRDLNYPGSTYTLTYDRESDQLKGVYYQALQQQRFEVVFERLK